MKPEVLAKKDGKRQLKRPRRSGVTWPDLEARARRIAGDRVLPNLVLLERGEGSH